MRRPTSAASARTAAAALSESLVHVGVEARPREFCLFGGVECGRWFALFALSLTPLTPLTVSGRRLRRVGTSCTLAGEGSKDAGYKSVRERGRGARSSLSTSVRSPSNPHAPPPPPLSHPQVQRRLLAGLVIASLFMVVEAVGGFWAHSIAIWTDAAHLLSDVSGFAVALVAARVAARAAKGDHTFGFHRIEVLGALASVAMTWFVTGILVIEAAGRVAHPKPVDGRLMFILAAAGVVVNLVLMAVLGGHHHHGPGGHDHGEEEGGGCGHSHGHGHAHAHPPPPRPSQPGDELAPVSAASGSSGAGSGEAANEEDEMEKGPTVPALALAPAAVVTEAPLGAHEPHAHDAHGHDAHKHSINVRGAVLHGMRERRENLLSTFLLSIPFFSLSTLFSLSSQSWATWSSP